MFSHSIKNLYSELCKDVIDTSKLDKISKAKNIQLNSYIDDDSKSTLLLKMIKTNRLFSVEWLLENHANVYVEDKNATPAFFYLSDSKISRSLFELFSKHHVDFDFKNSKGRTLLQDVVLSGNIKILEVVLNHTKKPFSVDMHGKNILFDAISSGCKITTDIIFKHSHPSKDFNIKTNEGNSLLLHFKDTDDLKIISFLLKIGVSPAIQDKNGKNIIYYLSKRLEGAKTTKSAEKISNLIQISLKNQELILQKDNEGNSILSSFIKNLSLPLNEYNQKDVLTNLIKSFVDAGVNINSKNKDGITALLYAIEKNDVSTAKILLEKGVNINDTNGNGQTPIMIATLNINRKYKEMIELLLSFNPDLNIKNNKGISLIEQIIYILMQINSNNKSEEDSDIQEEDKDYVDDLFNLFLSNKNINLYELNIEGNPLFFAPFITANYNIVDKLFKAGLNINLVNNKDENILFYYVQYAIENNISVVETTKKIRKILSYGIDLNKRDEYGGTILHKSIVKYPLDIIKAIVNCKPDLNAIDDKGRTIIHASIWSNDLDKIKYIVNLKSSLVNEPDYFGILPINYAAFLGNKDSILYLISRESFINNSNHKQASILNFFKRFYKNIKNLEQMKNISNNDKKNLNMLLRNMKQEFNIVD